MRKYLICIFSAALALAGCSDPLTVDPGPAPETWFVVDGVVTDQECRQEVRLSLTEGFFSTSTEVPWVSGARVTVSCGELVYAYEEDPDEPGTYRSVDAFQGIAGQTYRLDVDAEVGGVAAHFRAEDTVPAPGVRLDAIDYMYSKEFGLWTLALWGQDYPGQRNRYLCRIGINGHFQPQDSNLELPDDHFDGMAFSGFTLFPLQHTEETRRLYGDSFKPLERGDVVTLRICTLSDGYGEFLMRYNHLVFGTIPILTEQPSNLQTNVTGTGPVVGYFGACAICEASCVIDDPYRAEYRRAH
jgi:hypothetical protein